VVVAIPATGLVADLEAVGQGLEDPHHLVDGANLGTADDLSRLAEHTHGDPLAVDIEPHEKHKYLLKSEYVRTSTTDFHVTRLTEASFIVSHRRAQGGSPMLRVDQTEARNSQSLQQERPGGQ
jgi:hypothetical protein